MSGTHSLTEFHVEFFASLGVETTQMLTTAQLREKVSCAVVALDALTEPLNKQIATRMLEDLKSDFQLT